jgi:hypothetical protein
VLFMRCKEAFFRGMRLVAASWQLTCYLVAGTEFAQPPWA